MVATKSLLILLTFVYITLGAKIAHQVANCRSSCTNRFGRVLCCDNVLRNAPRCPPAPRILLDCNSTLIMVKSVPVTECVVDADCNKRELCCNDICLDGPPKICMPSRRNSHYLMT
ncbi:hypothetical protein SK128_003729 [Halocaridina rubra]|uniref:WAP domain-containing protein n=1 Tax=Halocaridina rubra TaxID=373956 RepID=A0AAN9A8D2_HALRR